MSKGSPSDRINQKIGTSNVIRPAAFRAATAIFSFSTQQYSFSSINQSLQPLDKLKEPVESMGDKMLRVQRREEGRCPDLGFSFIKLPVSHI